MLEAAGGGGGTPWESMTIDKMQSLIQNPDTGAQWNLVDGWNKSAELLNEHRFQVQSYRDNLAAAWPPQKSSAAAAYIARLDDLIKNLTDTYEASLANHDAFSSVTGSIYQAQVQMDKIYQEYKSNETALTAYNAKMQAKQESSDPQPRPSPSPSPSGEEPPVAPGRQEELRLQAVTLLSGVSSDLAQAQVRIVKPRPYEPELVEEKSKPNDGGGYVAPPIPPITPVPVDTGSSSSSALNRPSAPFPTPPNNVNPPVTQPGLSTQPGLILGGVQPLQPAAPTSGFNPIAPALPGGTGGHLPNPGLLSPSTGLLPSEGATSKAASPNVGRGVVVPREGVVRPGMRLPEGGMRVMAPGGVIGGAPTVGIGQPGGGRAGTGQPGTGRVGARRINPVGGVIGEGEGPLGARRSVGAGPSGGTPAEHATIYGQGAGRRSGHREESAGSHWDPDNPWETAEGVEPVVLPPREQRIDPGPAIGLG
ncbi:hypothetical protein ACQP2F_42550 [Actinoplanes sp. CA-030573]|uniref:hypothetical protein n=1 Tax=Actinoplanes sp. CA-030573 TaxID=3239898 RepID=UPI003D933243